MFEYLNEKIKKLNSKDSLLIINGAAGTGKTTYIKKVVSESKNVIFMAPTGKASEVLSNSVNSSAFTIQSAPKSDKECIIVIDEASMLSENLLKLVFEKYTIKKLILSGDINQIPPVEAGYLFKSILKYCKNVINLKTNYRSCLNINLISSNLLTNKKIKDDCNYICSKNRGLKWVFKQINLYFKNKSYEVLAYTNDEVNLINKLFTESKNMLQTGDKIVIKSNDNIKGVKNGKVGIVEKMYYHRALTGKTQLLDKVELENEFIYVKLSTVDDVFKLSRWNFSYANSIHTSQGSEYDNIVIFLNDLMDLNLLYTAVTRAKINVLFVGKEDKCSSYYFFKTQRRIFYFN
jgi:ATP-dependent exoDNAse (exonuclease V) alpha subunit